jgi:uncharacterized membrane protein YoaK (UPF0700 family)
MSGEVFRREEHGPLTPLLLTLTVVTGLVDAFSYLALGKVFVANMTGNVVFLAFALAGASGFSIPHSLAALGAFCLGSLIGGRLARRLGAHRGRLLTAASALEALLVAASVVVAAVVDSPGSGVARYVLIALLGLPMGMQNATAQKLAVPDLTTTVLTQTITGIFADARIAGGTGSRTGRRLLSVLAMFLGALSGAWLVLHVDASLSILVALILLCVVAVLTGAQSRIDRPWVHAAQTPSSPPASRA